VLSPCGYQDGVAPPPDAATVHWRNDTMQMNGPTSGTRNIDEGLERLRRDLRMTADPYAVSDDREPVNYAALEFELERMKKRLAIWNIFMNYMRDGASSWPDVQRSLTQKDFEEIVHICDGVSLRDLLLDEG
jgi:hypothetical protein